MPYPDRVGQHLHCRSRPRQKSMDLHQNIPELPLHQTKWDTLSPQNVPYDEP